MGHLRTTTNGKPYEYNYWSNDEVDKLVEIYAKSTNEELARAFPNRSLLSIYRKAYSMGFRKECGVEFKNRSVARKREKGSNWNGGRIKTRKGYIQILMPEHHRANKRGYVMEHIFVFERETGQKVLKGFCVHHINGIKDDNRPENLVLMTNSEHTKFHHTGSKRSAETRNNISKKRTKIVSYMGSEIPLNELAEKLSISKTVLAYRIKARWSDGELSLKPNRNNQNLRRNKSNDKSHDIAISIN